MNSESCKEYFNARAEQWDTNVTHNTEKMAAIVSSGGLKPGDNVLDIGSGTGVLLPYLRAAITATGKLTALDIADKMLELARIKYAGTADNYQAMDFFACREEYAFDVIMAYSCFPHFGAHTRFFQKAKALVKPGGRLIIAHSESRQTINGRHNEGTAVTTISLPLPDVFTLAGEASATGWAVIRAEENNEWYLLVLAAGTGSFHKPEAANA